MELGTAYERETNGERKGRQVARCSEKGKKREQAWSVESSGRVDVRRLRRIDVANRGCYGLGGVEIGLSNDI